MGVSLQGLVGARWAWVWLAGVLRSVRRGAKLDLLIFNMLYKKVCGAVKRFPLSAAAALWCGKPPDMHRLFPDEAEALGRLSRKAAAAARPVADPTAVEPTELAGHSGGEMRAFRQSLPMALLKAREAVMARFRPLLHEHDLTEQQWRVLRALTTADEFRAGELARVSSISMPSLSRILRTLEKRGLIQRGIEDKDLRAAQISITPSGRDMIALIAPHSERRYAEITAAFGAERLATLYGLLDELADRLGGPDGGDGDEE